VRGTRELLEWGREWKWFEKKIKRGGGGGVWRGMQNWKERVTYEETRKKKKKGEVGLQAWSEKDNDRGV